MNRIKAENIGKTLENLHTIEDVSLTVGEEEVVSIIGPSGCGKSTLFNIISGLLKPDKGRFLIDGTDYTGKTGKVAYMQQKDLLLPWKTIIENVALPLILKGQSKNEAKNNAIKYFKDFGLESFENSYPSQLSGGMRQRAALLRTYLFNHNLMLLDEPFGSLDAITKKNMQKWLLEIFYKYRSSILFITHDVEEGIFLSDKIYVLSDRPAKVKKVFEVNIPRPRNNETITSKKFIDLKKEILDLLY